MSDGPINAGGARWADATAAATLLGVDPLGLGGAVVRARPGVARDRWCALAAAVIGGPARRMPAGIEDDRLLGGLDLTATLKAGRPVAQTGLLAEADGGVIVAPMAERLDPGVVARLTAALDLGRVRIAREGFVIDRPARFAVLALDEGAETDEHCLPALAERLAFALDLDGLALRDTPEPDEAALRAEVAAARARLAGVSVPDDAIDALVTTAVAFGVGSLRAPTFALRAARAAAALRGATQVEEQDLALAARLVFGPRATRLPAPPDAAETAPEDEPPPQTEDGAQEAQTLADRIVEAVRAVAPEDVLAGLAAQMAQRSRGAGGVEGGAGVRGRPAGVRAGRLGGGRRIALAATLRAAAPWQPVRRRELSGRATPLRDGSVLVRAEDVRLQRRIERTETTVIFLVDASGSAALHRLGECKGAVELLLAEAYVQRTRAALVAFRGAGAETLLAPTRSLARAKRALADLPGGGGTPLAAGLEAALRLAIAERGKGRTVSVLALTDGRANVTRAGVGGRAEAEAEALTAARGYRMHGIAAALIDSAPRPRAETRTLAEAMGARYAPLPFPQAASMARVAAALTP